MESNINVYLADASLNRRLVEIKFVTGDNDVVCKIERKFLVDYVNDINKRTKLEKEISDYIETFASQALYEHETDDFFNDLIRQLYDN